MFFKAPCASGCNLQEVLSKASTSTLIAIIFSCCSALKIRCITPFSHHLLNLWQMLFHLPYFSGSALHLHPFSAIYKIALIVDKCVIVDFYIPTLNRKILFDSCVLRFCDIHVFIISYFDLSVNMLYFHLVSTPIYKHNLKSLCIASD